MTDIRVKAYHHFMEREMPTWGNCDSLAGIDFDNVTYFLRSSDKTEKDWDDVPDDIKRTFDRLGIPEANRNGLVVSPLNTKAKPSITRFEKISKNKVFSSLTWTQDSKSTLKLSRNTSERSSHTPTTNSLRSTQRFGPVARSFTCRKASMSRCLFSLLPNQRQEHGQFERTLIIADEGSSIHYVEDALHQHTRRIPCILLWLNYRHGRAKIRYSTVQNWSANVYNLVTKRGVAHKNATVEWVDGNIGSKLTMKYPAVLLKEKELTPRSFP